MTRVALISGNGRLPEILAAHLPDAYVVAFQGMDHPHGDRAVIHRFEHLGALFEDLKSQNVEKVVFAGAMSRPPLDPTAFDPTMVQLAPRLMAGLQGGDDSLLKLVIDIFAEQGFKIRGAHQVMPDLIAGAGVLTAKTPSDQDLKDADRAAAILAALSPVDVGQAVVVAGGLCLGVETLQGTDAMLNYVARTPDHLRGQGGVLVKAPKVGQDLRIDMPAIGPDTIRNAAKAGLSGIVIEAASVLLIDRATILSMADAAGLFIEARHL